MPFERSFQVSWAHLDANAHMANTAYLNVCVDVRMMYFDSQAFAAAEFARRRIGPVVRRDEVDYFKELGLLQPIRVTFTLAGISDDASRFRLRNEIYREDGKLAARVTSLGGWMDLAARKLIAPPEELAQALRALDRAEDFEVLESSLRK
jgi:acyl-CoA thioester hydrolase